MSPEQRAKAVAERFAAELPSRSVPELERIVTSAIKRALAQQLAELGAWAGRSAEYAHGRGKSAKGQDLAAVRIHDEWANRFKRMRITGKPECQGVRSLAPASVRKWSALSPAQFAVPEGQQSA